MDETERSRTALVVTDMFNRYDHEDGERLAESAAEVVPVIRELIAEARSDDGVDVIFVNDNQGDWDSSAESLIRSAKEGEHPELVEPLVPDPGDSFVLKLRHSIFYSTPVEYLLREREVKRLILAGQVTEQCILYSALDGYLRHYEVCVPRDAVAHIEPHLAEAALEMIERNMRGDICDAADCLGRRAG
jgi:nicotinamidase-related amidase